MTHPGDDAIMNRDAAIGGVFVEFRPMSPEEIERTVQFLLQQQARFAADLDEQSRKTDRVTEAVMGVTGVVGQLAGVMDRIAEAQLRTDTRVGELAIQVSGFTEQLSALGDHVNDVAGQIKTTDSHLGVLIDMFERHLREDHGLPPS